MQKVMVQTNEKTIFYSINLGVPRKPEDKKGDFLIFTKNTPYLTSDFVYENHEFERLHDLIKFNTMLNKQVFI